LTAVRDEGRPELGEDWERNPAVAAARAAIAEKLDHLRYIRENPPPAKEPAPRKHYSRRWKKPWASETHMPAPPDYSRIRPYAAGEAELEAAGTESVDHLVCEVNRLAKAANSWPVSQGDFPRNKRSFMRLVERRNWLRQQAGQKPEA